MIIPARRSTLPLNTLIIPGSVLALAQTAGTQSSTSGWSSIIGIATAIVGNILISFALNTQRLAHIRLDKNTISGDGQTARKTRRGTYSSVQSGIAEERARKNADSLSTTSSEDLDQEQTRETDSLIPKLSGKQQRTETYENSTPSTEDDGSHRSYLRSPLWWLGITLMVTGEAGNFLAYGFAPASIVSPLGVVAIVSNCLIAPLFLRERFRKRDFLGVVIAVGGTVTIVLSAQGSNPKLGPEEIWSLVKRWEFLVYLGVTCAAILAFMVLSNRIGQRLIFIDLGLVGLFGGYTALSTKGIASLLSYRLWRTLTFPITYVLAVVLIVTAILQIKYVNRALQRFDSTRVIPTQFVLFTISVIVGSAVLYRDFEKATPTSASQFAGGCALTFLGVWFLTSGRGDDDHHSDAGEYQLGGERNDEERRISLVDQENITAPTTPVGRTQSATHHTSASISASSFVSAMSQQSPSALSTPTPRSRLNVIASASAVPTLRLNSEARQAAQTDLVEGPVPGVKGPVTPRASLSSLFAPSSFSPLTTPLSNGLSVVVADQRGRLARNGSLRGSVAERNVTAFAANQGQDGTVVENRQSNEGQDENPSRNRERGGEGALEAVIVERPRAGRGNTVEVYTQDERNT